MKSMFGYTWYQPYGLSQVIPTLPYSYGLLQAIQHRWTGIRTRTTASPAKCKVCTTRQAQSHAHTASLLLIIHYTGRNARIADQAFKKGVVVVNLTLKYRHLNMILSKTANRKIFRPNDLQKRAKKSQTANTKIVRPANLKYGQISEIGRKTANLATLCSTAIWLDIHPDLQLCRCELRWRSMRFYCHLLTRCRIFLQLLHKLLSGSIEYCVLLRSPNLTEALIIYVHYSDTLYNNE